MADARRTKVYLTLDQLVERVMGITHASPIGLVTRTEPKMRKTGNEFYGRITKITETNVFVNCNYENAVNRQREREHKDANFQAGRRAFDAVRRIVKGHPTPILDYTRADGVRMRYLEVRFMGHLKTDTRYVLDGRTDIAKAEFQEFLQESSGAPNQGIQEEVTVRTYDVRNIVELRHGGRDYVVVH